MHVPGIITVCRPDTFVNAPSAILLTLAGIIRVPFSSTRLEFEFADFNSPFSMSNGLASIPISLNHFVSFSSFVI